MNENRMLGNFPQVTSSNRNWLKWQQLLPPDRRENHVYILFRDNEPMPEHLTGNFLRVHLSEQRREKGEDNFFQPEIYQPHRVKGRVILCPDCAEPEERVSPFLSYCRNSKCKRSDKKHITGPVRGVIEVLTFPDHVIGEMIKDVHEPIASPDAPNLDDVLAGRYRVPKYTPGRKRPEVATRFATKKFSIPLVKACVLVLDRRYDEAALIEIIHTCGILCDQLGHPMKN